MQPHRLALLALLGALTVPLSVPVDAQAPSPQTAPPATQTEAQPVTQPLAEQPTQPPKSPRKNSKKGCVPAEEANKYPNRDVCVSAHVYDVVQLPDGTRFLDVCTPQTPDEQCRFTIISLWQDREEVGELRRYRDADVQIRGLVQPMHGRAGMVLSHARQFRGGPPKFKPNPKLVRGFTAAQDRPPINDPNLRSQGGGRAFMNTRNQETLPPK